LEKEHFDVLHVQMPYSPLLAGRIINAAGPRTAVVGTFHVVPRSRLVSLGGRLLAAWCRRSLRRFDAIVSVSPAALAFAQSVFGIRSSVLSNAIWLNSFQSAKPFPLPSNNELHILFLGRLVPRKGCLLLLQAVLLLKADTKISQFRVTICGKGQLADELQRFVDDNGLKSCVTFTGFVSEADKPRYYASADITVFPSTGGESFGIVLIEAMASGRAAVLAGNNPGYQSVLESCPGDVLFDPHDAGVLADRIRSLLGNKELRRQIADWQQQHAHKFDIERVGVQLIKLYNSSLQHRRSMR
jgi:phosphatidylinositol alpha-mannosyltransferase